jgi:hypothetical protein
MAHIYHGKDTLILTDVQKEDFPSGLSRIDATYKCRTTEADNLAPLLAAGNRLPEFPTYIIRQNPTRQTGQDGFTTFTASSFAGTLSTSAGVPTVFGVAIGDFTINLIGSLQGVAVTVNTVKYKILSDTITRTFTILPNISVTTLATPTETVSLKVLSIDGSTTYVGGVAGQSISTSSGRIPLSQIFGASQIINVNRQSFGGVDEVQVTWGLAAGEYSVSA